MAQRAPSKQGAVEPCQRLKRQNVLGYPQAGLQPVFQRMPTAASEKLTYAAAGVA